MSDLKFSIVGPGPLSDWVNEQCNRPRTERGINITRTNWVETDLVDHHNELKLLALPIYIDALPTSILEAMPCGTPVLATSVGAIAGVIVGEAQVFCLNQPRRNASHNE